MDRYFLGALVSEIAPRLIGRRGKTVRRWGDQGLAVRLTGLRPTELVLSFFDEAPGLYLGSPPPMTPTRAVSPRLKQLLSGARVESAEASPVDRVVRLRWVRSKPSGESEVLDWMLEWLGSRRGAYLVDSKDNQVLDAFTLGPPRLAVGERFEPLPPPPGAGRAPADGREFEERLNRRGLDEWPTPTVIAEASGLSPLIATQLARLNRSVGLSWGEAFEETMRRLRQEPEAVVLMPRRGGEAGTRWIGLPIATDPDPRWVVQRYPHFNDAARVLVGRAVEEAARRLQEVLSRALSRSIARERALLGRLDREEESLSDAADLRRAGESLLAGLTQATPVEGGVEVPDPWSTEPRRLFIAVDPRFDLAGNVDRYFRRARRIDRSRQALEKRREEVRNRIESLETLEVGLDGTRQLEDLELLRRELEEAGVVKAQVRRRAEPSRHVEPLRFPTPEGGVILVGRSARSNEALTFQVARPGDLWFHAAQVPGAHVVLRGGDDEVEVTRAAAAAAFFSKARAATSVEVIYTARRNVARAKGGPPGLVRVNRFKSIRVRPEAPPAVGSSLSDVSSRKNRGGDGA